MVGLEEHDFRRYWIDQETARYIQDHGSGKSDYDFLIRDVEENDLELPEWMDMALVNSSRKDALIENYSLETIPWSMETEVSGSTQREVEEHLNGILSDWTVVARKRRKSREDIETFREVPGTVYFTPETKRENIDQFYSRIAGNRGDWEEYERIQI